MYLFIDTETTGKVDFKRPASDWCQPDILELSAALFDADKRLVQCFSTLVRCPHAGGWRIEPEAGAVHGITNEMCEQYGMLRFRCLGILNEMAIRARLVIAHNLKFDLAVINTAALRAATDPLVDYFDLDPNLTEGPFYCTMGRATDICRIPFPNGGNDYKWPKLEEAYEFFTGCELGVAHRGLYDVLACADIFFELRKDEREAAYIDDLLNVSRETS
jgi:DNA polymerase-3 subunit epsilon